MIKRERKTPINFRFKHHTMVLLHLLEDKLHSSKTDIVEKALQYYADRKLHIAQNALMQFAGTFSEKESEHMLETIISDRRNKIIKVKL